MTKLSWIFLGFVLSEFLAAEAAPSPGEYWDKLLGRGDQCEDVQENDCAYLYEEKNCYKDDWGYKYIIKPGERRGFPVNNVNPVETEINQKYANDMESFSVRQGCTLKIYKDANFSEDERIFTASQDQDLHMKKFKDGDKSYMNNVESYDCSCPGYTVRFGNPGSEDEFRRIGMYGEIPANCPILRSSECAIVYDDHRCTIEDWDNPLVLAPGEKKSFSKADGHKYENTIESIALRKGCTLTVFDADSYSDEANDKFTFRAIQDHLYVTLDSPLSSVFGVTDRDIIQDLDDEISSMICTCP